MAGDLCACTSTHCCDAGVGKFDIAPKKKKMLQDYKSGKVCCMQHFDE